MKTEQEIIQIPEELQQICRDIAKIAQKHKMVKFHGAFHPRLHQTKWAGEISFRWESGRHEEDSNQLYITSQFFIHTIVDTHEETN